MSEKWIDVGNYEELYAVSNHGRVKSLRKNIIMKPGYTKHGYVQVHLCKNGKAKAVKIHRLVACAFIENKHDKPCVNHIDSVRTNNIVSNLEWTTYSENQKHAVDHGEAYHNSTKLTVSKVQLVREMYNWPANASAKRHEKPFTLKWLGKCFKVDETTIGAVIRNKTWNSTGTGKTI